LNICIEDDCKFLLPSLLLPLLTPSSLLPPPSISPYRVLLSPFLLPVLLFTLPTLCPQFSLPPSSFLPLLTPSSILPPALPPPPPPSPPSPPSPLILLPTKST
jgi:hypothetical protein